jgi:hypothetical protein
MMKERIAMKTIYHYAPAVPDSQHYPLSEYHIIPLSPRPQVDNHLSYYGKAHELGIYNYTNKSFDYALISYTTVVAIAASRPNSYGHDLLLNPNIPHYRLLSNTTTRHINSFASLHTVNPPAGKPQLREHLKKQTRDFYAIFNSQFRKPFDKFQEIQNDWQDKRLSKIEAKHITEVTR